MSDSYLWRNASEEAREAWQHAAASESQSPGIDNVVEDTTPQLGGNLDINSKSVVFPTVTVSDVLDEDTMSGNSATKLATQQSIKAYVDTQVATQIANVVEDTTPQLGGNLDVNNKTVFNALSAGATIAALPIAASLASQAVFSVAGVFMSTASINITANQTAFVIPVYHETERAWGYIPAFKGVV